MTTSPLFTHVSTDDPTSAEIEIDLSTQGSTPITPNLYGKFTEHLGQNIYQGMEAQILFNPTFGDWKFRSTGKPSGGFGAEYDLDAIAEKIENPDQSISYLIASDTSNIREANTDALLAAYEDGGSFGWMYYGDDSGVTLSPDSGPAGDRAQRIEIDSSPSDRAAGIYQVTPLPLHRTRTFEVRCQMRAVEQTSVSLTVDPVRRNYSDEPIAETTFDVGTEWRTIEETLEISAETGVSEDSLFEFAITASDAANIVVERALLYPSDHVDHADPEIVELLRESDLPLLRWPGGNFVSDYDWRDGVGPVDARPTYQNPAWDGLEYNLFGTDEFMRFCENVGCDPMICVNAGSGTPEEAAAWVEYCNGSVDTPMGKLRAEHGHPEPYNVEYWEVGNEHWGKWQVNWSTPDGNADRYRQFYEAMTAVDPDIDIIACGIQINSDQTWNEALLEIDTPVRSLSDHILPGGEISKDVDRDELYRAYMGFSAQVGAEYRDLRGRMEAAGIDDPKLALTELQIYPSLQADTDGPLTTDSIPTPKTISEALFHAAIVHECIRTDGFVEMVTHSATVNHGGGIQKQRERVWADPVYFGRKLGSQLSGGSPVGVAVTCDTIATDRSFREIDPVNDVPSLDVVAALSADESRLTLMIVNRSSEDDTISLSIDTGNFQPDDSAHVDTLSGPTMYATNTVESPEQITPESATASVHDGRCSIDLESYSLTRVTFDRDSS